MNKKLPVLKGLLLLCFLFGNYLAQAQTSSLYGFTETTGTYSAISGTTSTATGDDGVQDNISIGFNFSFAGTVYTTFSITTNGFIRLGGAVGLTHWTNVLATTTSAPLLAPFWDDNNATGGNIQYMINGSAGNQVLTVQWTNIHMGGTGSTTTPTYSYQVKLYETSNVIEFIYGSTSAALTSSTASIGISSTTGNYLSVTPGSPATTSSTTANNGITAAVPANTIYTFTPPPPCSGVPNPGNTLATVSAACTGVNFTLSLQNNTPGTGVSYQWQTSPDGINWTNASSTNATFTTSQTVTTYYQAIVTCAASSSSDTSAPIMLGMNPFYNCYCTPISTCTNEGIDSVAFVSFSNTSAFCANTNGYSNYESLGSVASVQQGDVVPLTVKARINSNPASAGVWIDFDHSNTFDASEYFSLGNASVTIPTGGTSYIFSGNIIVPLGAQTGTTRMRIRSANQNGIANTSSCITTNAFGEIEDYLITINPATACFGTPVAGTVSSTVSNVACNTVPFTVSSTGFTTGNSGLTYQWQESNDGFTFTDIGTGTSVYANLAVTGITQTMYYQLKVTCANGGGFDVSPAITVNFLANQAPYVHDVESQNANTNSVLNSCWTSSPTNTTTAYAWHVSGNGTTPSTGTGPTSAFSGSKFFFTEASNGGTGAVAELIAPPVDVTSITSPILEFWYHMFGADINKLIVNVWNGAAWQAVDSLVGAQQTAQNNPWLKRTISLNGFPSPVEVKFTAIRGASFAGDISIDDFTIIPAPACPAPTAASATNILSNSAELNWTENGTATQWSIEYGPAGFTPGTGTFITTNSKPFTLNGLTPSTQYTYYVKALCSAIDSSVNATPVTFYTTQIPVSTFPWIENWETGGTDWTILNGSQPNVWFIGSAVANSGVKSAYVTNDGGVTNSYDINTASVVQLYRDIAFPSTLPAIDLSFDWKGTGENCCDYFRVWLVPTSFVPTPGTQITTSSGGIQLGANFNNQSSFTRTSFTIPATYAGTTARLVFEWRNDGSLGPNPPAAIDSLQIQVGNCVTPTALNATNVSSNSATIKWTLSTSNPSVGYDYYYNTSNTAPTASTMPSGSVNNVTDSAVLTNLTGGIIYYYWVRSNCGNNDYSAWVSGSFLTLPSNDLPAGAVTISVNAACSTFTNTGATFSTGEPAVSCRGTNVNAGALVWFKFIAPQNGFVRVSTDGAGTNLDTKLGLFTTSNPSDPTDLASFSIIGCDDDNGITAATASVVYASGLTPGATYYVGVDHFNAAATGLFCLSVDSVTSAMITATGTCTSTNQGPFSREDYTGWVSIVDDQGRLIANTRRTAPSGTTNAIFSYGASVTVNTSAVRQSGTQFYLDRNFLLSYSQASPVTTFDVKLYFLNAELAALQAVDASATLSNLNVTHQTGTTCQGSYNSTNGTNTVLNQTTNGTAGDISWIQVNTPGFSNFYIMSGPFALSIKLGEITATNVGNRNRVDWNTESELKSDVFELERSFDGTNFRKLATIAAKGEASNYSYWDETPANGLNHYRLKMTDAAGKVNYSKTVTAFVKENGSFTVEAYPNPVNNILTVVAKGAASDATITITDITGKVVRTITAVKGFAEIDVKTLIPGMYLVKYMDGEHTKTIKINKQ